MSTAPLNRYIKNYPYLSTTPEVRKKEEDKCHDDSPSSVIPFLFAYAAIFFLACGYMQQRETISNLKIKSKEDDKQKEKALQCVQKVFTHNIGSRICPGLDSFCNFFSEYKTNRCDRKSIMKGSQSKECAKNAENIKTDGKLCETLASLRTHFNNCMENPDAYPPHGISPYGLPFDICDGGNRSKV